MKLFGAHLRLSGYLKFLGQLLREHYKIIGDTGIPSPKHEHFIDGYLTAARTLNLS